MEKRNRMADRLKHAFKASERTLTLGMDTRLTFGKWKGRTVRIVLKDDPNYLDWLQTQEGIRFTTELAEEFEREMVGNKSRYCDRDDGTHDRPLFGDEWGPWARGEV